MNHAVWLNQISAEKCYFKIHVHVVYNVLYIVIVFKLLNIFVASSIDERSGDDFESLKIPERRNGRYKYSTQRGTGRRATHASLRTTNFKYLLARALNDTSRVEIPRDLFPIALDRALDRFPPLRDSLTANQRHDLFTLRSLQK